MNIIRGAITVEKDCKEEIKEKTELLLRELAQKNGLTVQNTKAIIFSTTQDIHSYYPAKAARECGFAESALFSAVEPEIEGGLPLCIRAMIFAENADRTPVPVYLGKAATLRRDLSERINIALDGPAGSGKSTIAKKLAEAYHILYLDTGAMYRACALKCHKSGVDVHNHAAVCELMKNLDLTVQYEDGTQHTYLDGKDVSSEIRQNEISMMASDVAALPCVRETLVAKQREIASRQSCVLDGRDIGTAVLPDARYKFFITAKSSVRAQRRLEELRAKGNDSISLQELQAEIERRDEQDTHRQFSPLRQAKDAVLVDTSKLTIDEVVCLIRNKIQEKV